ncbi:MAG: hypothetical protein AAGA57_01875 [Planctomycetota bacterium]
MKPRELLEWVQNSIARDRKKFVAAVSLMSLGLLLWGRLILLDRVPRTAVAIPADFFAKLTQVEQDNRQIERPEPVFLGVLPQQPRRDVFAIDPSRYRPDPAADNTEGRGKNGNSRVDDNARLEQARQDVRDLTLESVIQGQRPRAVLNDRLLRPGESIEGFELIDIVEDNVVVARDGLAFRLRLPRPLNPNAPGSLE